MKKIREKKHRLKNEDYIGKKIVSFTSCINRREKLFINDNIFFEFSEKLIESIIKFNCEANIYLFMPDHVHLIIQGNNFDSDVKKSIDLFKQKTGFWFGQNMNYSRWQKDYYDHIIRNSEDLNSHIYYILNNPVKAGLVDDWKNYKYIGSTIYNFDEWE